MAYFDDPKHVEEYIKMIEGYDGGEIVETFRRFVPEGSSVLELGTGPGKDLDMLAGHYSVIGSDSSQVFIDLYKKDHPEADLLVLDASTIRIERRFDAIYSNKVLMHLSEKDLVRSFRRQWEVLNPGGRMFHTFWSGEGEEFIEDLRFVYYTPEKMKKLVADALSGRSFEIEAMKLYAEDKKDDSFYLVLRKG